MAFVERNKRDIQHAGQYSQEEMKAELVAEQAFRDGIKGKDVIAIDEDIIRKVFHCWFNYGASEVWFNEMAEVSKAEIVKQIVAHSKLLEKA